MKKVLVTGAAGFIGFHLCKRLLKEGVSVCAVDNLNDYYDVKLKEDRINKLKYESEKNGLDFEFIKSDIIDKESLTKIFDLKRPNKVVNLAAQAGVRYSIENPSAYIQANVVGFSNIIETNKQALNRGDFKNGNVFYIKTKYGDCLIEIIQFDESEDLLVFNWRKIK